jgi:hypothetical protein
MSTRRRFKCAACGTQFSVTSGTILASRKMSFTDLLAAICIIVNCAKGVAALRLARDLDCQHKTAFVLSYKIRDALASEMKGASLFSEVESTACISAVASAQRTTRMRARIVAVREPQRQAPRCGGARERQDVAASIQLVHLLPTA